MPALDVLAPLCVGGSVVLLFVIVMRRMGWLGKSDRTVTSGVANWLADINEMLQPQQPTAEQIQRLREGEEGEEDEGEGDPPDVPKGSG